MTHGTLKKYYDQNAALSACGRYRYMLSRVWGGNANPRLAVFVMLNPSTADAIQDDPTIRKCVGFARRWGLDGIRVVNLFAWRATKPSALALAADPVGPDNDKWISVCTSNGFDAIVAAWGRHGGIWPDRVREVCHLIGRPLRALALTSEGHPSHPLMLPYGGCPQPWMPQNA